MHKSNIFLESLNAQHSDTIFKWRSDKSIWKNFIPSEPISKEKHNIWISNNINSNKKKVFIAYKENTKIGLLKFYNFDEDKKCSFWSFYLKPGLQGKVLGALLEWKALDYFFLDLEMETLFCNVLKKNHSVIRLHKRFGFEYDENIQKLFTFNKISYELENLFLKRKTWVNNRDLLITQIRKVTERNLFKT